MVPLLVLSSVQAGAIEDVWEVLPQVEGEIRWDVKLLVGNIGRVLWLLKQTVNFSLSYNLRETHPPKCWCHTTRCKKTTHTNKMFKYFMSP